ncbi:MAG: FAD-dependent oxidoreductase [Sphingomonadaceae bacterium]|nr:FAD-dependent oxidoreductase [Sphingomonadaceae bacterium]
MNGDPSLVVIGAGPAGLALARHYSGPSLILEASHEVGGLCRSIEFGGGVFDVGGHSFHTPHAEVAGFVYKLMRGNWHEQRRDARVWFDGALIPYPFQAHFGALPDAAVVAECRAGSRDGRDEEENLEDWLVARFGAGVARHFLLPYNRKLWAHDLRDIACDWVGERIAGSEGKAARKPLGDGTHVGYPAEGGFGAIFRKIAKGLDIAFGKRVVAVDPEARTLRTADGEERCWSQLVSTMPLTELTRMVGGCPEPVLDAVAGLKHIRLKILHILAAGDPGDAPHRVYIADPAIPPHKVAFNHTASPALRKRPVQAIIAEIAHSPHKKVGDDASLIAGTVDWLASAGFIRRADVIETRAIDVEHGYPLYTHDRRALRDMVRGWLATVGIRSIGRFGAWSYVNSDECIRQGMALAREIAPAPNPA